jgi:hypothetical protein
MNDWYVDLCEYYGVSPQEALELGTRKPNRRPNLPGSSTTHAVSEKTFEEIWALSDRKNEEQIFQFYKDQGAWSAFRQVVRHKDMTGYHLQILSRILRDGSNFCEYGCGVAPYTNTLLNHIDPELKITVNLSDVECEHLTFGLWRAKKTIERRGLKNVTLHAAPVTPNALPVYPSPLDAIIVFEVLEHVPSPLKTIKNIQAQMSESSVLCENFIKHDHDGQDGPDLYSAALEREEYYRYLQEKFVLVDGQSVEVSPSGTRIWRKI